LGTEICTVGPVALAEDERQSGAVVVSPARVAEGFPGSPIILDHTFELAGDRIVSLEIG
jgi:hypothetical protein